MPLCIGDAEPSHRTYYAGDNKRAYVTTTVRRLNQQDRDLQLEY
ncbi:hypothetical protein ACIA74_44175 [Streptomyces sp. NPDC051658]